MTRTVVELDNVTKKYPGSQTPAVSTLSLRVEEGSVFGLLGPNGAGKSTLVMMMCGLLAPDQGRISVLGLDTAREGQAIRRQIGVAPQEIALFPLLTAYENLFYFGRMYGLPATVIRKRVNEYLERFGLESKRDSRVNTFSGGMKRRLNLIAAILHDPRVVILDEPTTGVDVQSRKVILDFVREMATRKITIIYSSHVLTEAESICSHLAILDTGRLAAGGTLNDVLQTRSSSTLEQLFLELTGKPNE